jgi:hypothetical protein
MNGPPTLARRSLRSGSDAYDELLSRTRDLPVRDRAAREEWYARLDLSNKQDLLFEFEVLLKATACFANPRNHPGPPRRTPVGAHDFRTSAILFRDGAQHAIELCRMLLGQRDRTFVFHRYLETVLPEDNVRARLAGESSRQISPEDSLIALRHALSNAIEVAEGLLRAPQIPYRLFYAVLSMVQREIAQNAFFNPLTALEFRPEFDRIQSPDVLNLIQTVPTGEAHRLVALTFLSLFRMLRYLRVLGRVTHESGQRGRGTGRIYFVLSVLRSDARALSDYLQRHSGRLLGENFRDELMGIRASELRREARALRARAHDFIAIKSALEGIAGNLRLEMRRVFQHDLPAPDANVTPRELRRMTDLAVSGLRPAIRNTILFLGKALGTQLEERGLFDDRSAKAETSERLRRDVWMFGQILRAFLAKAKHTSSTQDWSAVADFQFVREFLAYFRSMGYPLLRSADYPRFDAFLSAMTKLNDTDLVDPARVSGAVNECMAFQSFLEELFEHISRREELALVPFDRRSAAAALRMYLGEGDR